MRIGRRTWRRAWVRHGEAGRVWQSRALVAAAFLLLWPVGAMAEPLRVVALGDSLTAGYGLPRDASFPAVLERRLRQSGRDVRIENAGVSGDTAADGLARLDWSVPDDARLAIVELGANDMLRGLDPDRTKATLDAVFGRIRAKGLTLVVAGMRSVSNWGPDYRAQFDAIYPALAQKYGAPLYPFFTEGVTGRPDLLLSDGLHPNAKGVEALVDRFLPFITPVVDKAMAGAAGKAT